jgi:hypothetical protein
MTLASLLPRRMFDAEATSTLPESERRVFRVDENTRLLGWCNWHDRHEGTATLVLLHGQSGSAVSPYMLGTAAKALLAGFNVVRLNLRNSGDTESWTPTLYSALQTRDVLAVGEALAAGCDHLYFAGFSMGGNQLLELAGELSGDAPPWLRGIVAVSPPVDLSTGQLALDEVPLNRLYREYHLREVRLLVRRKARLRPERFALDGLDGIHTVLEWDERVTAPHFGFRSARDYYRAASSLPLLARIRVPTLIIHARDDPIVPFEPFSDPSILGSAPIALLATDHGGHCAFIARRPEPASDRFWAENRVVDFLRMLERGAAPRAEEPVA